MTTSDIGVVVPTLNKRPEYLLQSLLSIRKGGTALVHIVMPQGTQLDSKITSDLYDQVVIDPKLGLSAAIHTGILSFPEAVKFVTWLGDDDNLKPGALDTTSAILRSDERVVLAYGGCEYIDKNSDVIFVNRSGRYAKYLMRFGPQLVPQPGSLFRRSVYDRIGGLNANLKWAFDLDLFIRLSRFGKLHFIPQTVSSFRWHDDSLSVGGRDGSVREASSVRKKSNIFLLRPIAETWELPLRYLIKYAGNMVSKKKSQTKSRPQTKG